MRDKFSFCFLYPAQFANSLSFTLILQALLLFCPHLLFTKYWTKSGLVYF
jgi:hypothetical protein